MSYTSVSEIVDTLSESTAASASASQRIRLIVTTVVFLASVVIAKMGHKKLPPLALEILKKEITAIDDMLKEGIVNGILDLCFVFECKTTLDG